MRLNASQAQSKYKVNRSTIGRWVKAGKLSLDENKYFEEEDFLLVFRQTKAWSNLQKAQNLAEITPQHQKAPELPLITKNQLTGEPEHILNTGPYPSKSFANESEMDKPGLDRLKAIEDIRDKRRKNNIADGKFISRNLVKRFVGRLSEIDHTQWGSFSSRVVDSIMSTCEVSDQAISVKIAQLIDEEVFVILDSIKRCQTDFIASLPVEQSHE